MLKPVHEAAGLGIPPSPYYTNNSECINSVMHEKMEYKCAEWNLFNNKMQELVQQSYQRVELAVLGIGAFKFRQEFKEFEVDRIRWCQMSKQQRALHMKKVSSSTCHFLTTDDVDNDVDTSMLAISAADADIPSIPLDIRVNVWKNAALLLCKPGLITLAPKMKESDPVSLVVASKSSVRPHIVTTKPSGQFVCESSCPMWVSSKLCSHTVAAAQFCSKLHDFISWLSKSKAKPNIGKLAKTGMPTGAGRKGGKPARKKSRTGSAVANFIT